MLSTEGTMEIEEVGAVMAVEKKRAANVRIRVRRETIVKSRGDVRGVRMYGIDRCCLSWRNLETDKNRSISLGERENEIPRREGHQLFKYQRYLVHTVMAPHGASQSSSRHAGPSIAPA